MLCQGVGALPNELTRSLSRLEHRGPRVDKEACPCSQPGLALDPERPRTHGGGATIAFLAAGPRRLRLRRRAEATHVRPNVRANAPGVAGRLAREGQHRQ
jgi:hypothetical protein